MWRFVAVEVDGHASCHRDCVSWGKPPGSNEPCRLLLDVLGHVQIGPADQVRLESNPPGADATTSLGAGCKTPCSVSVPAPNAPFTVTFALPKYQPASVPVNVIKNPGDFTTPASVTTDPNPVFAELQPATPPKPVRKPHRPRKPKPAAPAAAPAAAAAPASGSPFPDPNAGKR